MHRGRNDYDLDYNSFSTKDLDSGCSTIERIERYNKNKLKRTPKMIAGIRKEEIFQSLTGSTTVDWKIETLKALFL